MITVNCDNCGIECLKTNYSIENYKHHFCSKKCQHTWQKENIIVGDKHHNSNPIFINCEICGKETRRTKCEINRNKHFYCSKECNNIGSKIFNKGITLITVECAFCGKNFEIALGKYNQNIKRSGGRFFCNRKHTDLWKSKNLIGKNSHAWQGGKSPFIKSIRSCVEYRNWRTDCFIRDNYTCQKCGKKGGYINAHHKTHFINIIKLNNIITMKEAKQCKELWDIDNGITLCIDCHKEEHSVKKSKE